MKNTLPGVIQDFIRSEAEKIVDRRDRGATLLRVLIEQLAVTCFEGGLNSGRELARREAFLRELKVGQRIPVELDAPAERAIDL